MPTHSGRITKTVADRLPPNTLLWDGDLKGFGIRRQGTGSSIYIVRLRVNGRVKQMTIGSHGPWTADAARLEAMGLLRQASLGEDPLKARNERKAERTFAEFVEEFRQGDLKDRKPSTRASYERLLKAQLLPAFGKLRLKEIEQGDIKRWHRRLNDTPYEANRALAVMSVIMNLMEAEGLRPQGTNPCRYVKRYKEPARDRFPSVAELAALGVAMVELEANGQICHGTSLAVRLAIMTGCRMGELLALRWEDVDREVGVLNIRDAKAGARKHPIGASVLVLLADEDRMGPFPIWCGNPNKRMSQWTLEDQYKRLRIAAGCPDLRFHDLRHGYGTFAGQTGANAFLVRDALGHKTLAMTNRYVGKDQDPVRELADTVSARAAAALDGRQADVLPIKQGV